MFVCVLPHDRSHPILSYCTLLYSTVSAPGSSWRSIQFRTQSPYQYRSYGNIFACHSLAGPICLQFVGCSVHCQYTEQHTSILCVTSCSAVQAYYCNQLCLLQLFHHHVDHTVLQCGIHRSLKPYNQVIIYKTVQIKIYPIQHSGTNTVNTSKPIIKRIDT